MRLVQNSFVGGEIAPELFGRHDSEAYFHAAKRIENFLVRKTGGLRKRQGTQLMWHASGGDGAGSFRVVPYFHDRTSAACLLIYRKQNAQTLSCRFCKEGAMGDETAIPQLSLQSNAALAALKCKQIGDTIFLTAAGTKTVRGMVDYNSGTVAWSEMEGDIAVPSAPGLALSAAGFDTDTSKGFKPSTRTYGLIGVRDNVYSAISEASCQIWLYWVAGATVTVSFTPNWTAHDYYILCLKQAGQWAVIDTIYPSTATSVRGDLTWANTNFDATGTINGVAYDAGTASPSTAFKDDPNGETDGCSTAAAIIGDGETVSFDYKTARSTATSLRLWLGGLMRQHGDNTQIDTVSTPGTTTVTLYKADGVTAIKSWEISARYSQGPQTLAIDTNEAVENNSATYKLKFETENGDAVVLRGAVLGVPQSNYSLVDDNLVSTDIAGVMEPLTVGDTGMDCALADVWEQRLVFAASEGLPFTLWFSRAGDVTNFYTDRPQTPDSAFSVTIPALTSSRILHTVTTRWFLLFTESGEYAVGSAGNSGFGYNTISIKPTSNVGAHESIEPVTTESSVLFVAADGRTVYEMQYSLEQDNITPANRTMLAHHLTEASRIRKVAFVKFPEPQLWCLLEDGTATVMTYVPAEKVFAWSRAVFAGGGLKCVDIAAPGSIREGDGIEGSSELWLLFEHEGHPGEVWVERLRTAAVGDAQDAGKAKCADHCGYAAADYPDETDPQTNVAASVTTVRPEISDFNTIGLSKNIFDCCIRLDRSGAIAIRPDADGMAGASSASQAEAVPVEGAGTVQLVTKDVKVLPRAYSNTDGRMVISSADAWPCNILSVLFNIEVAADEEGGR